jgi:TPR repeat protein
METNIHLKFLYESLIQGDNEAQFELAEYYWCYPKRPIYDQDIKKIIYWFKKAAIHGDGNACCMALYDIYKPIMYEDKKVVKKGKKKYSIYFKSNKYNVI